ncbi:hypothetical protein EVAR_2921_1 [Eumeta japonica]|uniref:Uncharacterized protein n=1 Tax=Eumeta variegata TaxID=151549 RepID=A0A4C1T3V3_EUMVA|nr:hypothetical protein EVAR_2921_1 [Eumeta japonica]
MKAAYHTYFLKEECEFRVVLRSVPKEFALEDVKTDLLAQSSRAGVLRTVLEKYAASSGWATMAQQHALETKIQTAHPPVFFETHLSGHTVNYLGCPRAPK